MECKVHNIAMQNICDTLVCGLCYEESLHSEKLMAKNQDFDIILVPKAPGHKDMVMRGWKNGKEF